MRYLPAISSIYVLTTTQQPLEALPQEPEVVSLHVNRPLGNTEHEYRCDAASTDVCSSFEGNTYLFTETVVEFTDKKAWKTAKVPNKPEL